MLLVKQFLKLRKEDKESERAQRFQVTWATTLALQRENVGDEEYQNMS